MATSNSVVEIFLNLDETDFNGGINSALSQVALLAGGFASLTFGIDILHDLGTASLDMAISFEESSAKVSTLFGDVEVDTASLNSQILELSRTSGIAASELNEGLYQALSAGVPVTEDMGDAIMFLEEATKLSIAGFTSMGSAVDLTTTVLNAYGMSIDETSHVMDVLIETQNAGKTTVDQLAGSMGKAIPTANSLGVSFEELSASIAILTKNGIGTAEAVTAINSLMVEGLQPTSKLNQEYKSMGYDTMPEMIASGMSLSEVLQIMNDHLIEEGKSWTEVTNRKEASVAANILMQDSGEDLDELTKQMTEDNGALNDAYSDMETTQHKLNEIQQSWNALLIELGSKILPPLNVALDLFIANSKWLMPLILGLAVATALFAIAAGIAILVTSPFIASLIALGAAAIVAALPFILVALAVVAFILVVRWAYDNLLWFQKATNFLLKLMTIAWFVFTKVVIVALTVMVNALHDFYDEHKKVFKGIAIILAVFALVIMANFVFAILLSLTTIGLALLAFAAVFEGVFVFITNVIDTFSSFFEETFKFVEQILEGINMFISGAFTQDWESAWNGVQLIFEGVWKSIANTAILAVNLIISAINGLMTGINSVTQTLGAIPGIPTVPEVPMIPEVPYFAKGGVVNGAGLGVIGEAGPEMILPLNDMGANFINSVIGNKIGFDSNGANNINVELTIGQINDVSNVDQLADILTDKIDINLGRRGYRL